MSYSEENEVIQSIQELINKKDEQIKQLDEENKRLKEQLLAKSPERFSRSEVRQKVLECRRALDNFESTLSNDLASSSSSSSTSSSASTSALNRASSQGPSNSSLEASESESVNRPFDHDTAASSSNSHAALNHQAPVFQPRNDSDHIVDDVNNMLPTQPNQRRFMGNGVPTNNNSMVSGVNHNNNNMIHNVNRNNFRKQGNHNPQQNTVFVSWPGAMDHESLRALFEPNDVADIRYTQGKQFAHVDLRSAEAMRKALELNGQNKHPYGNLRVEAGKPKSANNNNNDNNNNNNNNGGIRPHQNNNNNKPYINNRQPNKNGNVNGYQKHNNNNKYYNNNHNNNHVNSFYPQDDKDRTWKPNHSSHFDYPSIGQSATTQNSVATGSNLSNS